MEEKALIQTFWFHFLFWKQPMNHLGSFFWVAEINRGDFIILQCSTWLSGFVGWLIYSERLIRPAGTVGRLRNHLNVYSYTGAQSCLCTIPRLAMSLLWHFLLTQWFMQKVILTFLVTLLASPMFSMNAALPPANHLSLRTLTFRAGLLNQYFLHPISQFGFMI